VGAGLYRSAKEAFSSFTPVQTIEPDRSKRDAYAQAYGRWEEALGHSLR
jgi:xylulokinase